MRRFVNVSTCQHQFSNPVFATSGKPVDRTEKHVFLLDREINIGFGPTGTPILNRQVYPTWRKNTTLPITKFEKSLLFFLISNLIWMYTYLYALVYREVLCVLSCCCTACVCFTVCTHFTTAFCRYKTKVWNAINQCKRNRWTQFARRRNDT